MPTTVILRFRDLSTPRGDTIRLHKEIIQSYGYVWWGWWALPQEKIPRNVFANFTSRIRSSGPMTIYLVDSGQCLSYRATLTDILVSQTDEPIDTPEPDKTPRYYLDRSCLAWFKFTSIESSNEDALKALSYDEVKDVLDDPTANDFQDKRIFSIQEMIGRLHRTIYFANPYDSRRHKCHEVVLAALRRPEHFVLEPVFKLSRYIIQLSDLHFSKDHHAFPKSDIPSGRSIASLIIEDLKRNYKDPPAAVVISGDLTWQGKPEEFDDALDLILKLRSVFELDPYYDLVVVPGNHDIVWAQQNEGDYDRKKPVQFPSHEAQKNYADFFVRALGLPPNDYLSLGRRYLLSNYVTLDILGLNSTRLEQKHFAGYGFVGLEQVEAAASSMGWSSKNERTTYRMMVLHHHVIPAAAVEEITTYDHNYSLTLDAGQIVYKALQLDTDLISHGHKHQPFISCVSRPPRTKAYDAGKSLAIHGAGSAGVEKNHLGLIGKNAYSIYEFDPQGTNLSIHAMSEDYKGFEPYWKLRLQRFPEQGLRPGNQS